MWGPPVGIIRIDFVVFGGSIHARVSCCFFSLARGFLFFFSTRPKSVLNSCFELIAGRSRAWEDPDFPPRRWKFLELAELSFFVRRGEGLGAGELVSSAAHVWGEDVYSREEKTGGMDRQVSGLIEFFQRWGMDIRFFLISMRKFDVTTRAHC